MIEGSDKRGSTVVLLAMVSDVCGSCLIHLAYLLVAWVR